jgi:hypothetical protein
MQHPRQRRVQVGLALQQLTRGRGQLTSLVSCVLLPGFTEIGNAGFCLIGLVTEASIIQRFL